MITYVNSSNTIRYSALFEKATLALKDANIITDDSMAITSLEEYFAYIKELSSLKDDQGNPIGRRYTILPIDEETFDINADTRQITVPPSFKKNGIAVKGDEVAEVLYFKIDRFFDATDFNNMEIYIQWETAPDSKGVTNKGVSREWVRDIESEPGKIIFGWPLSSSITENAGNIKFAVRFFQWTDDNKTALAYNFSTLTATALINPSLDFKILDGIYVDDVNEMIQDRFENSVVVGGVPASLPVYLKDLAVTVNLDKATGTQKLYVQAYSPDAGLISYEWKQEKDGIVTVLEGATDYVPVTEEEGFNIDTWQPEEFTLYYQESNTTPGVYTIYAGEFTKDVIPSLLKKYAVCEVDETGLYWAIATNRVGLSTKELDSTRCEVPSPKVLIITTDLADRDILGNENDSIITLKVVAQPDNDYCDLSYQWYKDSVAIEGATSDTYVVTQIGHYYVKVTNTLNKDSIYKDSKQCRITHHALAPVVATPAAPVKTGLVSLNVSNPLAIVLNNNAVPYDEYTYQWKKFVYDATGEDGNAEEGIPSSNDVVIEGATTSTYLPTESGTYYCVITNHLNGTTEDKISPFFFITA